MTTFSESVVEQSALDWLRGLGYLTPFGPSIAPEQTAAERADYQQVVLVGRLWEALPPRLPSEDLAAGRG